MPKWYQRWIDGENLIDTSFHYYLPKCTKGQSRILTCQQILSASSDFLYYNIGNENSKPSLNVLFKTVILLRWTFASSHLHKIRSKCKVVKPQKGANILHYGTEFLLRLFQSLITYKLSFLGAFWSLIFNLNIKKNANIQFLFDIEQIFSRRNDLKLTRFEYRN